MLHIQPIEDFYKYSNNGNFGKNGLIGKIKEYGEDSINKIENDIADKITKTMENWIVHGLSSFLDLISVGILGYSMYQSIKMMFLQNKSNNINPLDKILLSDFIFMICRILNTIVKIKGGI